MHLSGFWFGRRLNAVRRNSLDFELAEEYNRTAPHRIYRRDENLYGDENQTTTFIIFL
jgi:hypothetical protein